MKQIKSLINKKIKTSKPGIVQFFYPNFIFLNEKNENTTTRSFYMARLRNHVIFLGTDNKYVNTINNNKFKNDIIYIVEKTSKDVDIDLDNKYNILQFIYNKHNQSFKHEKKRIKEIIKQLNEDKYYEFVKNFWIIGDSNFCLNYDKSIDNKIDEIIEYTLTKPNKVMKSVTELISRNIDDNFYYLLENKVTNLFIDATKGKQYNNKYLISSIDDYENKLTQFKNECSKKKIINILTKYRTNVDNLKENDIGLALLHLFTLILT